jgi:hypothetical protein
MCNQFSKQAAEKYAVGIDYEDDLVTGETIASVVVVGTEKATGTVVTSTIIDSTTTTTTTASAVVKAGTSGVAYVLTFTATSSLGYVYEDEIIMNVRDR